MGTTIGTTFAAFLYFLLLLFAQVIFKNVLILY